MPTALVVRAAGTNCEIEVCHGFEMAGATPELAHVDALIAEPERVERADIIAFPGGFSYGDDVASGRIFAMKLREKLYPALRSVAARGVPMIGICNGFQVLVQVGLLPGMEARVGSGEGAPASGVRRRGAGWGGWPEEPPRQMVALSQNKDARYVCRWVPVKYERESVCLWTRGLADGWSGDEAKDVQVLPVGHGEGRLATMFHDVLPKLEAQGQIAIRYLDNYNGSEGAVAGICDPSGRIFGLMPHPDRYLSWTRHPYWTRLSHGVRKGDTPGLRMFRNAVEALAGVGR
jgi:phosphoribosylformylglycinamidine synthase